MPYHRSEEHTSELQSHDNLVCRLLLEKKNRSRSAMRRWVSRSRTAWPSRLPKLPGLASASFLRADRRLSFFFNDPAPTEISPLSLHDALPINDTATTEIYTLSLHDVFRSRWSPYH